MFIWIAILSAMVHVVTIADLFQLASAASKGDAMGALKSVAALTTKNYDIGKSVSQSLNNLKSSSTNLQTGTLNALNKLDSAKSSVMGETSGPQLVDIIKPKLKLGRVHLHQCMSELKLGITGTKLVRVKLVDGQVNFHKENFEIVGAFGPTTTKLSKPILLSFQFTDLEFSFDILSTNKLSSNKGLVGFVLKGKNRMTLTVKVPNDLSKLKSESRKGTCFVEIKEVTFQLSNDIEIKEADYGPKFGLSTSSTKNTIQQIITDHKSVEELKDGVKPALLKLLEPILTERSVFCDSEKLTVVKDFVCDWDRVKAR